MMTEIVVDQFEVVEVHRDHTDRDTFTLKLLHGVVQPLGEPGAVGQPGQRIPQPLFGNRRHQPPILAHSEVLPREHGQHQQSRDHWTSGYRSSSRGLAAAVMLAMQQRHIGQPDGRPTRQLQHHGNHAAGPPAGHRPAGDEQHACHPADVEHPATVVRALGRQVGEQAVGHRNTRHTRRHQGQRQAVTGPRPDQHHRGHRQHDDVGERVGQRDGQCEPVGLAGTVDGAENRHPADDEQRCRHDQPVEQCPAPERPGVVARQDQQSHARRNRENRKAASAADGNGSSFSTTS